MTGNAVVVDGDPSYTTALKSDADFTMTGGRIEVTGAGMGSKGISADGNATFTGGRVDIACSGNGTTYTTTTNTKDAYSSTCITIDGNLYLYGGEFNLSNSGTGGKCIKSDGLTVIGENVGDQGPTITGKTTGQRIAVSGGSSGGWGGMDNGDYSNPKVVKSVGNLTVNAGTLSLTSTQEGGEGLESKATLTVNGGSIDISTSDDAINAANHIQINGGELRCLASNNDAIDSNGTITIAGGVVIAAGAGAPECGIDCDNGTFAIKGGTVVAMGASTSSPTTSACTQRCVIWGASVSTGTLITLVDPNGKHLFTFKSPKQLSGATFVMTSPGITTGTHTIYTGGTVSGGTEVFDITLDGTYTPGTSSATFSPSSMVTNLGGSSGGAGGGGGRPR